MGEGLPREAWLVMLATMQTDPILRDRARSMRREMTEPETRLWLALRDRRLAGIRFSRQVVIGSYIADFCARSRKIIVEVDGDTHTDQSRDEDRTAWLATQGYRVIRFTNDDVMTNLEGVLLAIVAATTAPHPTLSPVGRGLKA